MPAARPARGDGTAPQVERDTLATCGRVGGFHYTCDPTEKAARRIPILAAAIRNPYAGHYCARRAAARLRDHRFHRIGAVFFLRAGKLRDQRQRAKIYAVSCACRCCWLERRVAATNRYSMLSRETPHAEIVIGIVLFWLAIGFAGLTRPLSLRKRQ